MSSAAKSPVPGARPTFPEEDIPGILSEIGEVLRGGRLILGPKTRELEAAWAKRVGTKHAIAVSSCTAALEISVRHLAVRDKEVVVPTNTFVATANAVVASGNRVVFADMDERDYGIDVNDAIARITPDTAAVIVVHIAGFIPRELDRLVAECKARNIRLIEDCAHAHGSTLRGREAGSFGDVGCFSFYPTKVLTCGVGGLITTNDDSLADLARSLRHHGQGASLEEIVHAGNDWVLDEVRAVLATAQLRRLDEFLARRTALASLYDKLLSGDERFTLPALHPELRAAYYKYPVLLREGVNRDAIRKRAYEAHAIELGSLYSPPCHLMPVFRSPFGTGPGTLPKAERTLSRQLCLPMHAQVSDDDARRSVEVVRSLIDAG
jgi:dTDP-4-amino-4,6-dideoxygalactose transaminase